MVVIASVVRRFMVFSFGLFAKLLSCADNQVAHVQQGTVGTAKQANIEFEIKFMPADGHQSCQLKHAGSPFFGSFSDKSPLARV